MAERLGSYELLGRIATGGMAEIFRARQISDAGFEKDVVVKRILPQYTEDIEFIVMFQDEAVLAAKLNHPNIVQVFDFKSSDDACFIAMEYVEGVDLRRLLYYAQKANQRLGQNRAVQIAIGMTRGLGHAHDRVVGGTPLRIVHRDVSPHNVLISLSGDVKVMDFGIAKAAARAGHTATGVVKGKLSYMSPEQAQGLELDYRTDIYATGVVLWEMLAQRRLFVYDSELETLRHVQMADVPPIRSVCPDIHPDLEACVNKFLAPDKEKRYQRMRDAEKELQHVLHALGGAETAALDEFAMTVIPEDIVRQLRDFARVDGATKVVVGSTKTASNETVLPPLDSAETQLLGQTDKEGISPSAAPQTTVATVTPSKPIRPSRTRNMVAIGVAAGIVVLAGGWGVQAMLAANVKPPVAHVEVVPPPAPPPPPPPAERAEVPPAVADPKPEAHRPPPRAAKPEAAAEAKVPAGKAPRAPARASADATRLEFACPVGSVVYDGMFPVGSISKANRDAFPLAAGSHVISVKTPAGESIGAQQRFALEAGELDKYSCSKP